MFSLEQFKRLMADPDFAKLTKIAKRNGWKVGIIPSPNYVVTQQFKNAIKTKSKPYRKDWWNRNDQRKL